jgi:3alpha(or 20beta)-hydroxysteroid dehydrogenase
LEAVFQICAFNASEMEGWACSGGLVRRDSERKSMRRFEDKVVIITGAAGGIGLEACRRFASEGAKIVAVDLHGSDLAAAVDIAVAAGGEAISTEADVRVEADVAAYVATAVEAYGRVDVLFNNAGIEGPVSSTLEYDAADFDRVIDVNVKGVWLGIKHVVPAMLKNGKGAIVNTASVAGLAGTPGVVAYGASKHAVVGLTKTAAREFAALGIRTNAVAPSPVNTRMWDALVDGYGGDNPEEFRKEAEVRNPMGRYGEPDEVVGLVTFLASDDASYVNGAIVPVDGGARAM